MSVDVYRRAAIGLLSRLRGKLPAVVVMTSSQEEADCREAAERLALALSAGGGRAACVQAPACDSMEAAGKAVEGWLSSHTVTLLPLPCLRESERAMLLAAAAGNAILLERRKRSRTDEIGGTLETLRNLGAEPLGFLLE